MDETILKIIHRMDGEIIKNFRYIDKPDEEIAEKISAERHIYEVEFYSVEYFKLGLKLGMEIAAK